MTNLGMLERVSALFMLKEHPELSKKISLTLIADVMRGVVYWISLEMQDTKTKASEMITKMEPGIITNYEYKLPVLALFTLEILSHEAEIEASKSLN